MWRRSRKDSALKKRRSKIAKAGRSSQEREMRDLENLEGIYPNITEEVKPLTPNTLARQHALGMNQGRMFAGNGSGGQRGGLLGDGNFVMRGANIVYVNQPGEQEQAYAQVGEPLPEEDVAAAINAYQGHVTSDTEKPHPAATTGATQVDGKPGANPTVVVMSTTTAANAPPVSQYDATRYAREQRLRANNDAVVGVPVINTYQANAQGQVLQRGFPVTPPARPPQRDNFVLPDAGDEAPVPSSPPLSARDGLVNLDEVNINTQTAYPDITAPTRGHDEMPPFTVSGNRNELRRDKPTNKKKRRREGP
jgi:hypothetical protein